MEQFLELYKYATGSFWVFLQTTIYLMAISGFIQKAWKQFIKFLRETNTKGTK